MCALEMHAHLQELQAERALASLEDLATDSAYMADLDGEIAATTGAYVGVVVTRLATQAGVLADSSPPRPRDPRRMTHIHANGVRSVFRDTNPKEQHDGRSNPDRS